MFDFRSQTIELLLHTVFNSEPLCETTIEGGIDVLLAVMQPYLPGYVVLSTFNVDKKKNYKYFYQ